MKFYLGYRSAIQYWLSDELRAWLKDEKTQSAYSPTPPSGSEWDAVFRECTLSGFTKPLDVLVRNYSDRRFGNAAVRCHLHTTVTSPRAYVQIGKHLYVPTPGLAFAQMCSELTLTQAIVLGYELCGLYMRDSRLDEGFCASAQAISAAALRHSLGHYPKTHGIELARTASKYILDNSASPMETVQAIMFTVPKRMGGYAMRNAVLNYPVELDSTARSLYNVSKCLCDFYLPEERIDVEYDSSRWHDGIKIENADLPRGNALGAMGITTIHSTSRQILNLLALDSLVKVIFKAGGKRIRGRDFGITPQRRALHNDLLMQNRQFTLF